LCRGWWYGGMKTPNLIGAFPFAASPVGIARSALDIIAPD
jgi:hypothetical protein